MAQQTLIELQEYKFFMRVDCSLISKKWSRE